VVRIVFLSVEMVLWNSKLDHLEGVFQTPSKLDFSHFSVAIFAAIRPVISYPAGYRLSVIRSQSESGCGLHNTGYFF
jgi:hypothetical protein